MKNTKREDISKALDNLSDRHIEEVLNFEGKKKNKNIWLRFTAIAACVCIITATAVFLIPKQKPTQPSVEPTQPTIEATYPSNKAIITYVDIKKPNTQASDGNVDYGGYVNYTEEELFSRKGLCAFRGTVLGLENFTVDFGKESDKIYGTIITVKIEKVYKGDLLQGNIIRMDLGAVISDDSAGGIDRIEPNILDNITVGSEGIFMPTQFYDADVSYEKNDKVVYWRELADCGIGGDIDSFFTEEKEIYYRKKYFDSLRAPETLDDVEAYVIKMLEQYNS